VQPLPLPEHFLTIETTNERDRRQVIHPMTNSQDTTTIQIFTSTHVRQTAARKRERLKIRNGRE
jgi:hypothetical protein